MLASALPMLPRRRYGLVGFDGCGAEGHVKIAAVGAGGVGSNLQEKSGEDGGDGNKRSHIETILIIIIGITGGGYPFLHLCQLDNMAI